MQAQFTAARCVLDLRAGANFSRRQIGQRGQVFVARGGRMRIFGFRPVEGGECVGTQ